MRVAKKRKQNVHREYSRSREKSSVQAVVDDFYDESFESAEVGGGDPRIAMLMNAAIREEAATAGEEESSHRAATWVRRVWGAVCAARRPQ